MRIPTVIALLAGMLSLHSCATYQTKYAKATKNWETQMPDPGLPVAHSVFLIGDAGTTVDGQTAPALRMLEGKLKEAGKNSSVVYLGDNLYPNGLGPKRSKDREEDERRLRAQLDILKGYKGKVFFIAGNHDWYEYGIDGLERQKDFIEDYLDEKNVWMPEPGCGDPEEIEINDNLTIVLVDSQWYLEDWDGHYEINDGCEVKSRAVFQTYLEEAIKGNRNKNVLIAMHHPPYTYGPHGGHFTLRQHLFPLTDLNKNLYLPLPGLGSMVQFLRASVGHRQDVAHPLYRQLSGLAIDAARKNGSFVFASGHEHTLQHIELDEQFFVVSGAGSKQSPVRLGKGADFASGQFGFAQIDYYKNGAAWIKYWTVGEDGGPGQLAYRKQIRAGLPDIVEEVAEEFPELPEKVEKPISETDFVRGPLWNFLWGEHYRTAYNAVVTAPTLDLAEYKGGVEPVKRGGGYQTNSLRLQRADGKQYNMRSIDKDPTRTLGYPFNQSFVVDVLKDNFSAAHPLGAIPAARLADAAGIYYTSPELYYVPRQKALDVYNDDYAEAMYLVEERPDDEVWSDSEKYDFPPDILSTADMIDDVLEEHDEFIDYAWVVRSRIFDVLIGDWDRHDDQWRWAEYEEEDKKYYRPIPRDRDQAFSKYDGLVLGIARGTAPDIKKLLVYDEDIKRIQWLVYNARHFDRTFLSGADWSVWEEQVRRIQAGITDEVIERAFRESWPPEVYELDGPEVIRKLKARRDKLVDIARRFYEFVSREVDVLGTTKKDLFLIERHEDGSTHIQVYDTNSEGEKEMLLFERTFLPKETKEIRVYGLDDDDFYKISGQASDAIKIRVVGGLGEDSFVDDSRIGGGKHTIYYDASEEDNFIQPGSEARVRLGKDPRFNIYNRRSVDHEFDYTTLLPSVGFNPDDGVLLGALWQYTAYGFRKEPYAALHSLSGKYALATGGFALHYSSEFIDLLGKWELLLEAGGQTPLYSINFYGFGNDSTNPEVEVDDGGLDFNRVRQQVLRFSPAISRRLNSESRFLFGPTIESIKIERTEGRFIDEVGDQFDPEVFQSLEFLGVRAVVDFRNADHPAFPARGIHFLLDAGWKQQLNDLDKSFPYLDASLSAYQHLDRRRHLVFATRVGVQHRFTEDYEFYQGAMLSGPGQDPNIRGFRRNRFVGSTAFFQNIDLRLKLLSSANSTVPFSMGITGGFDHGRVWYPEEDSDTWHYSYGGGLWLSPFDMFVINASLFRGDGKANRVNVTGSFFF